MAIVIGVIILFLIYLLDKSKSEATGNEAKLKREITRLEKHSENKQLKMLYDLSTQNINSLKQIYPALYTFKETYDEIHLSMTVKNKKELSTNFIIRFYLYKDDIGVFVRQNVSSNDYLKTEIIESSENNLKINLDELKNEKAFLFLKDFIDSTLR
jgi:hypothetical protein